ncbi:kinase-like domain-containing protein [Chaetomidium leptoderma]|uniref:non-specific serine/threonine protein kinase n=1 Tax=Chaetomidium leptoderma TaxID=669021 RepID=A0AAN6VP51_9PEZI|nr:kinase-like domain-containing protein [Chaetomidium leptoderma]
MASLVKWARTLIRRAPSPPLRFPTTGFDTFPPQAVVEEEQFDEFKSGIYYPVNIGDVYASKYQILGKLGFGTTSTVWLARNLLEHQHVVLKVYTQSQESDDEFQIYDHLNKVNTSNPGYRHLRTALDQLVLPRPSGDHRCLVLKPMWDSWRDLLRHDPSRRFTEVLLKAGIKQLLLALDCLHTECKLVHTDIKADNILNELVDEGVLEAFTKAELETPSPRKFVGGQTVYRSRRFERPRKFGDMILSDFGTAVRGDIKRNHIAQPDVYRSPEIMLKAEWSYPVDIWNVGCMIWDLFEGKHLFYGDYSSGKAYTTRAHLAEVIGMLGPPPLDLLHRGIRSSEFFAEDGRWIADVEIPKDISLEASEERLEGENKAMFLEFMRGMLQWRPEDRKTARELAEDPWLNSP